jgi:hypothetical protein
MNGPNPFEHFQMVVGPPPWWNHGPPQPVRAEVGVPKRVQVALALLDRLTAKTGQSGMPHGHGCSPGGVEVIEGQRLTREETLAQGDALTVVRDYVTGRLKAVKRWDEPPADPTAGLLPLKIRCPACTGRNGRVNEACEVCGGRGEMAATRLAK